jgi:hypothetical protein
MCYKTLPCGLYLLTAFLVDPFPIQICINSFHLLSSAILCINFFQSALFFFLLICTGQCGGCPAPGTGKTTVARCFAHILRDAGARAGAAFEECIAHQLKEDGVDKFRERCLPCNECTTPQNPFWIVLGGRSTLEFFCYTFVKKNQVSALFF